MGNNSDKPKPSGSPVKSLIPPNRNPNSKIINSMLIRTVKLIEEKNYFTKHENFNPKTIYFENPTLTTSSSQPLKVLDSTQPLFEIKDQNNIKAPDSDNRDSIPRNLTKTPSTPSIPPQKDQKKVIIGNGKVTKSESSSNAKISASGKVPFNNYKPAPTKQTKSLATKKSLPTTSIATPTNKGKTNKPGFGDKLAPRSSRTNPEEEIE